MYSSLSLCHRDTLHPMNPTLMLSGGRGGEGESKGKRIGRGKKSLRGKEARGRNEGLISYQHQTKV